MAIYIRTFTGAAGINGDGASDFSDKITTAVRRGFIPIEAVQAKFNQATGSYGLALTCLFKNADTYEGFLPTSDIPVDPTLSNARFELTLNNGDRSHCERLETGVNNGRVGLHAPELLASTEDGLHVITAYLDGVDVERMQEARAAADEIFPFRG